MDISRSRTMVAALVTTALVLTACGGSDESSSDPPPDTAAPENAGWRDDVEAVCNGAGADLAGIEENDGTAAGIAAEARAFQAVFDAIPAMGTLDVPAEVQPTLDQVEEMIGDARDYLDDSIENAEAGDTEAAQGALEEAIDRLSRTSTAWAIAGAPCGADPARVENADLTVPLEMHSEQITAGFESIWVSEQVADRVVRLDPESGEVQATIDVGDSPFRMQPADGSMWVRTTSAYVEIDPDTNEVGRTLAKADVGPSADRSWAVDGALWICDGRRLHRYDLADLALVATIGLELDCREVWAGADLVVASNANEDPGESGTSAAAFVDPATNTVLATVPLPGDVGGPAVLRDAVFFAGYGGTTGAVIDRATWTLSATPDLGVASGGSQNLGVDGDSIYIVDQDHQNVLRVDSATFTVADTIEPLGVNALLVHDGALWTARGRPHNVVQRFDLDQDS